MPQDGQRSTRGIKATVKAPLIFSAVLAAVTFVVVLFAASGGTAHQMRVDTATVAAGIAFIVSLVVAAMLMMIERPNADHLGKGSGINRVSSRIPGGAAKAPTDPDHVEDPAFGQRRADEAD
ncbi:hypothetical protein [Tersicoccus solisilvae]|uniref:hypothetical protein n=1 Tax=Tersicoccus solisilvae TaxID=1882339 RepID=UPI001669B4BC|nr:hypothetical protein [Tersicoccus solisilvae]